MKRFSSALGLAFLVLSWSVPFWDLALADGSTSSSSTSSAAAVSIVFAEHLSVPGVSNVGKVSEQLFRGAQPHIADLAELKKLGITTIVDLRGESSHTREEERAHAEALGIHFVSIPLGGFSTPSSAQLAQFFTLLRQTPSEKVFVHCRFGHDRTGVFIAAYRIAFQHWTANQALSEMNAFGFSHFFHPSMIVFIRDFPNRLKSDPAFKDFLAN